MPRGVRNVGPRPKPTALKLLQGSASKAQTETSPDPDLPEIEALDNFTPREAEVFEKLRDKIHAMRMASRTDREMLVMLTRRWVEMETLDQLIKKEGHTVEITTAYGTNPRLNPHVLAYNQCARQVQQLLETFGLSPSGRARGGPTGKGADRWDDF